MNSPIAFSVQGEPKGQPRPRAFAMNIGGGRYSARVFDAGTAEGWKSLIAAAIRPVLPAMAASGPVQVKVGFVFRRPKSHCRANGDLKPGAPVHHTGKPDIDNLQKALFDAITQTGGVWNDDSQIAAVFAWKNYGPTPGATVEISPLSCRTE